MAPAAAPWLDQAVGFAGAPAATTVDEAEAHVLDELLKHGFHGLRFPPRLEARFQQETGPQRLRTLLISCALVSVLFNWMLLSDWMMIPDVFDLALHWRLFVFTPVNLIGLFVLMRVPSPLLREAMIVFAGVCAAALNTWLCIQSQDALAGPYLVSLTAIVVYCNTVARIQVRPALVLDTLIVCLYFYGWWQLPQAPLNVMAPAALTLLSAVVFTLYGACAQEHDVRENWLRLMRERVLQDALRQANASLEATSRSDALTELASRRHFDESLMSMWSQARDAGAEISLMVVDIDDFKAYNAREGHPRGDACLQTVAAILRQDLSSPQGLVARLGGEEFIVAMCGTPLQTAVGAAERVRKAIEGLGEVSVSVGVSCMRPNSPHASMAQLLAAADEALHLAKKRGRNRVIAFGTQD